MKVMQDKDLDKIFKDHFETMELAPSAKLWDNIAEQLEAAPAIKVRKFPYWSAAAAVLVGISVSWWLLMPSKTIRLYQDTPSVSAVISAQPQSSPTANTETSGTQQLLNSVAQVRSAQKVHTQRVKQLNNKWKESRNRLAENIHHLDYNEVTTVAVTATSLSDEPIPALTIKQQVNSPAVTYADASQKEVVNKEIGQHTPIRNMGDVINFLVGKIDKRKNKVIHFSTTEEGSMVSAINIGPLRYKTDTNN